MRAVPLVSVVALALAAVLVEPGAAPLLAAGQTPRSSGVLTIGGTPHPYLAEGSGQTCIVVAMATSYPPLFSDRLKQKIRFVYVDFKHSWHAEAPPDLTKVSLDSLVDEVDQVRRGLGLDKVCVLGHSAPGFLALEYALRQPANVSHLILVGVEPYFTTAFRAERTKFWETQASAERKAVLKKNVERIPDEVLKQLSPRDAFALRYVRNGPRYFFDPSYDFYWAWSGKHYSAELLNHYLRTTVGEYDPRPRLASNSVPMFVALGRHDYNIPYYEWDGPKKTTPQLTIELFERSGHFPMIEEADRFDERLVRWLDGLPGKASTSRMQR